MQGRSLVFGIGWWSRTSRGIISSPVAGWSTNKPAPPLLRFMALKAADRAAVHGHRLPVPSIIDAEEVEKEIEKGKEEKEKRRQEVEKAVDSQLSSSDLDTCPSPPHNAT